MTIPAACRPLLVFVLAFAFALVPAGGAAAKPLVGKDGKIYACYKVKGKPKGELRVVKSARAHCRRGERKVAWVASGAIGAAGAPGAAGSAGHAGAQGSDSATSTATLEERVVDLTERVKGLEAILEGVTNESLSDAIAAVSGLSNAQLLAAVGAVPLVGTLCGEVTGLVAQTNDLRDSVGSLVSILGGSLLGPIFGSVGLPTALPETLTCPSV